MHCNNDENKCRFGEQKTPSKSFKNIWQILPTSNFWTAVNLVYTIYHLIWYNMNSCICARWFNTQGDFHMLRKWVLDKGNLLIWSRISSHYTSCSRTVINHRGSTRRGCQHKRGEKKQIDISQAFIPVPPCIRGHFWHFVSSFFLVFISVVDGGLLRDPNISNCHSE